MANRIQKVVEDANIKDFLTDHHRFLLYELLDQIDFLDGKIFKLEGEIWHRIERFEEVIPLCGTIPELDRLHRRLCLQRRSAAVSGWVYLFHP